MNATKPLKSLLIDDDLDDQEIFSLCLKHIDDNVQCRVANNGIDALNILSKDQEYTPDVIFLDINMPKMNGLACLEKLKEILTSKRGLDIETFNKNFQTAFKSHILTHLRRRMCIKKRMYITANRHGEIGIYL